MRIGCITVAVGNEPSMFPVKEILLLAQVHDVVVLVDHATSVVDELAAAHIGVQVAVKSYLELPGMGVVLADPGQARSLAAMHEQDPFDLLLYDQRRCADLAWHEPTLAAVPMAVRPDPDPDVSPWQQPYRVQQLGFAQAADVSITTAARHNDGIGGMQETAISPKPVRDVQFRALDGVLHAPIVDDGPIATVRHTPEMRPIAQRIADLMARSKADLILAGRPRGPHGDADPAYLCRHVVGIGPVAQSALRDVAQGNATGSTGLGVLFQEVVKAGGGALVVPAPPHGCDSRSFDSPLPPMAQAARDWVTTTALRRRAAAALPSRGGLVERGLYLADAPAGVIAWCRQRPWAVRRLAALPRRAALDRLDQQW